MDANRLGRELALWEAGAISNTGDHPPGSNLLASHIENSNWHSLKGEILLNTGYWTIWYDLLEDAGLTSVLNIMSLWNEFFAEIP